MLLNESIIIKHLKEYYDVETSVEFVDELHLGMPLLYDKDTIIEDNHVYVCNEIYSESSKTTKDAVFIYVSNKIIDIPPKTIIVNSNNIIEVFNVLQKIFITYNEWEEKLNQILLEDSDIEEMVKISSVFFGNVIKVFNNNNTQILAEASINKNYQSEKKQKDLKLMRSRFGIVNFKNPAKGFFYKNYENEEGLGHKIYGYNIYFGEIFVGNVAVQFDYNEPNEFEFCLFRFFALMIEKAMKNKNYNSESNFNPIHNVFIDILNGNDTSNNSYLLNIKKICQMNRFIYQCLIINTLTSNLAPPNSYLCEMFENRYSGSYSFSYDNNVVLILIDKTDLKRIVSVKNFISS